MAGHLNLLLIVTLLFAAFTMPSFAQDDDPFGPDRRPQNDLVPPGFRPLVEHAGITRVLMPPNAKMIRARIEKALATTVEDMKFVDTPLFEVVQRISREIDIPVFLDEAGIDLVGIAPDDKVTYTISHEQLHVALESMLKKWKLTYIIQEEVLVITSEEVATEHRGILLRLQRGRDELKSMLEKGEPLPVQSPEQEFDSDKVVVHIYPITFDLLTAEQAKELLELTLEDIEWNEPHYIKAIGQALVVKQTEQVHWQIFEVLRDLAE